MRVRTTYFPVSLFVDSFIFYCSITVVEEANSQEDGSLSSSSVIMPAFSADAPQPAIPSVTLIRLPTPVEYEQPQLQTQTEASSPISTTVSLPTPSPSVGVADLTDYDDSSSSDETDSSVSLLDHSDAASAISDDNTQWEEAQSHLAEQEMEYVVLYEEETSSEED